jgi:hypothetical protein
LLAELPQALGAERRIPRGACEPDVPENETADAREWHCAELAARRRRQSSKDAPTQEQAGMLAHQSRPDLFCGQALVRHAPNLTCSLS